MTHLIRRLSSGLVLAGLAFAPAAAADEPSSAAAALLALHRADAAEYAIHLDERLEATAALVEEPVYLWTNPTRSGGQTGAVFVWTDGGRPAAVGTIFSHPENGRRVVCHEFHALAATAIHPRRPRSADAVPRWQPEAGVPTTPLADAPEPASSEAGRILQARALAREFEAESRDEHGETWRLRLLPKPLATWGERGDILGGAMFAFVTSAGTDPETVLILEVRLAGLRPRWKFSPARFSDRNLHLRRRGREVWSSIRDDENVWNRNADQTFRFDRDRVIDELPEVAAAGGPGSAEAEE